MLKVGSLPVQPWQDVCSIMRFCRSTSAFLIRCVAFTHRSFECFTLINTTLHPIKCNYDYDNDVCFFFWLIPLRVAVFPASSAQKYVFITLLNFSPSQCRTCLLLESEFFCHKAVRNKVPYSDRFMWEMVIIINFLVVINTHLYNKDRHHTAVLLSFPIMYQDVQLYRIFTFFL